MPSCLTTNRLRRFAVPRWDRPGPLTCRHRRRACCNCDGPGEQAKNAPAISVSKHTPPASQPSRPAIKPWEDEKSRAVMRSLDPYPEAKAAFIAVLLAEYKDEL